MSTPINLRSEFGHRWKIGLDEAAGGRWSDPWNYKVLCRYGDICPWGGELLAASTTSARGVANRLRRLSFVEIAHDGSDGLTVVFPRRHLSAVTKVMKPRRALTASPAQLAVLERGRVHRTRSR